MAEAQTEDHPVKRSKVKTEELWTCEQDEIFVAIQKYEESFGPLIVERRVDEKWTDDQKKRMKEKWADDQKKRMDHFFEIYHHLVRGNSVLAHEKDIERLMALHEAGGIYNTIERKCPDKQNAAARFLTYFYTDCRPIKEFNSQGEPFVRLTTSKGLETIAAESSQMKQLLRLIIFNRSGEPPAKEAIDSAARLIAAYAMSKGPTYTLSNRTAWYEGMVWIDMSDHTGRAIRVGPDGWSIETPDVPLFKSYRHQKPLIVPIREPEGRTLRERMEDWFLLANHDPATRLLHLIQLPFSLVPGVPHPISIFHGEQGSAKTSCVRRWKELIDPSYISTLSFPRAKEELVQALDHHWFAPFDNLVSLWQWQEDEISRASTGGGSQKRKLYTDDEDQIYDYTRVVSLNGINICTTRPDLLDRAILHHLPYVPLDQRLTEADLKIRFDKTAPLLLGAILDTLSAAMQILPILEVKELYRMADFTRWGAAIAQAMGYSKEDFFKEYGTNIQEQNREVLETDPVGVVVLQLWQDWCIAQKAAQKSLDGVFFKEPPKEGYSKMSGMAESQGINTNTDPRWPKNSIAMSRRLNELKNNLRRHSIEFTINREDQGRIWTLGTTTGTGLIGETQEHKPEPTPPEPTTKEPEVPKPPVEQSDDRERRWTDLLSRAKAAGTKQLPAAVLAQIYTQKELTIVGRDLLKWQEDGRVGHILNGKDSHWLIMEGDV